VNSGLRRFHRAAWLPVLLGSGAAIAGPTYQPPPANLVYGNVTHGQRLLSVSGNPAAPAADLARHDGRRTRSSVPSVAAGLEYGNVQEIFDAIDELSRAFAPSAPGTPPPPGQDPDKPDGGISIGDILDGLDDDTRAAIEQIADEVTARALTLAFIATDGYARASLAGDIPVLIGQGKGGGAWTLDVNWSGSARAFSIAQEIAFDPEAALAALEEGLLRVPNIVPIPEVTIDLTGGVLLNLSEDFEDASLVFLNDSSLITKSTQSTEFRLGYSREVISRNNGKLYLGAHSRLHVMRLSRLSVRFGDITDSEELFEDIRNADFRSDTGISFDLGALWAANNYQIGVQYLNINQPTFEFNEVDTQPYTDQAIIDFLEDDQRYRLDSQFRLEASVSPATGAGRHTWATTSTP
jgi:hypothetical protein